MTLHVVACFDLRTIGSYLIILGNFDSASYYWLFIQHSLEELVFASSENRQPAAQLRPIEFSRQIGLDFPTPGYPKVSI